MLLRLYVKGFLTPWAVDLNGLEQIITMFPDKSKKGKGSEIPTLQIVRFPRLVYYRNHERSDVIHFTSSGIWTASHFVFAVSRSYFLFRNCEAAGRGNPFPVWYIIEITNEVT